jgi:hypothetical protein
MPLLNGDMMIEQSSDLLMQKRKIARWVSVRIFSIAKRDRDEMGTAEVPFPFLSLCDTCG